MALQSSKNKFTSLEVINPYHIIIHLTLLVIYNIKESLGNLQIHL
jgi:hypothetical protein